MSVTKLHEGDPRAGELAGAILDVVYERGIGVGFSAVLGALEIVKAHLIKEQGEK